MKSFHSSCSPPPFFGGVQPHYWTWLPSCSFCKPPIVPWRHHRSVFGFINIHAAYFTQLWKKMPSTFWECFFSLCSCSRFSSWCQTEFRLTRPSKRPNISLTRDRCIRTPEAYGAHVFVTRTCTRPLKALPMFSYFPFNLFRPFHGKTQI